MTPAARSKEHYWLKMFGLLLSVCLPTFGWGMTYVVSMEHRLTSVETAVNMIANGHATKGRITNHIARATDATHEPTQETAGASR